LRTARATQGSFSLLNPLSGRLERVTLTTTYGFDGEPQPTGPSESAPAARRRAELRRDDGTLAGRYDFAGAELVAFQWHEGGVRARRANEGELEGSATALARPSDGYWPP
jgi:hypothetical protein